MADLILSGATSGSVTLSAPAVSGTTTLTLPTSSGTVLSSVSDLTTQVKSAVSATGSAGIFAARAWVNFNGTGTVAVRNSGGVSSISDNGVGDYTVNFSTAMPDADYSAVGTNSAAPTQGEYSTGILSMSSSSVRMLAFKSGTGNGDATFFSVVVVR